MGGDDAANKAILNEITILVSLITQLYAKCKSVNALCSDLGNFSK